MKLSATIAVGLGALVEELFFAHRVNELILPYRRLHEVRRRILQEVEEKAGKGAADVVSNIATAIKQYESEIEEALAGLGADPAKAVLASAVEEYAEVLRLDVPVGGGKTLEDLLYGGRDEVLDRLHEVMMALFMEYAEINEACGGGCPPEAAQKLEKLTALELAAYVVYGLYQKQKIDRKTAVEALGEIVDKVLS
jgi:hypothetical protein